MSTEWQPIETAPKDGREILAFAQGSHGLNDTFFAVAQWANGDPDMWTGSGWFWPFAIRPTHWMPLPAPPSV